MEQDWITRYEAADRLSRSKQTIARWITQNDIEQRGQGRYAKYRLSDLLRIKHQSEANKASGRFSSERQPEIAGRPKPDMAYGR
ncbi:helix-turn-helix domain-containing protein [Rhodococcus qingshengii]|uniref:helix-turn-helix domain-containing protein n=1 Tax=Rhodococcus TaxID=1827 RepID=UPI003558291C